MPEPPKSQKIFYWDSCVFLSRFQRTAGRIDTIEKITSAAEEDHVRLLISTYALSETVRISPSKDDEGKEVVLTEKQVEQELELISGYFENDYIIIKPLTQVIAEMAREYVAKFGLKPGDAVHVATAIFWDVPVFHTYDDKVLKRNGKICKDGCDPLIIEEPSWVEVAPASEPPPPPMMALFEGLPADKTKTHTEIIVSASSAKEDIAVLLDDTVAALPGNEVKALLGDGSENGDITVGSNGAASVPPIPPDGAIADSVQPPAKEEASETEDAKQE